LSWHFNKKLLQSGTTLVEALVTMFLVAVIGLGAARILGNSALAQRDMNVMGITLGQMRASIQTGACNNNGNLNFQIGGGINLPANCSNGPTDISVAPLGNQANAIVTSVSVPAITTADKESTALFGGSMVLNSLN
jgi:Tfp pilus assembly protein PilV